MLNHCGNFSFDSNLPFALRLFSTILHTTLHTDANMQFSAISQLPFLKTSMAFALPLKFLLMNFSITFQGDCEVFLHTPRVYMESLHQAHSLYEDQDALVT